MRWLALLVAGVAVIALAGCRILDPNPQRTVQVTIREAAGPVSNSLGFNLHDSALGDLSVFYPDSLPFTFRKSVDEVSCPRLGLGVFVPSGFGLGGYPRFLASLDLGACAVFVVEKDAAGSWTVARQ